MGSKHPKNAPCHCGSGKKYKKCCFKMDHEAQVAKLTNTFRDEIKQEKKAQEEATLTPIEKAKRDLQGVPNGEIRRRGQLAMMRALQLRKLLLAMDREHLKRSIALLRSHGMLLDATPISEICASLQMQTVQQIKGLSAQLERTTFNAEEDATLAALESALGVANPQPDYAVTPDPSVGVAGATIPLTPNVAKKLAESEFRPKPKDGPIIDDDGDDDGEFDDDDDDDDLIIHAHA